jgi:hypothetical protein
MSARVAGSDRTVLIEPLMRCCCMDTSFLGLSVAPVEAHAYSAWKVGLFPFSRRKGMQR